jgi:hypothetical protein
MKNPARSRISERDEKFIRRRRKLVRYWRFVGPLLWIMILGFAAWTYVRSRLLIDPFAMLARLEAGDLPESTLVIMAALTPVFFTGLLVLFTALILVMYGAISGEKRYLAIIDGLSDGT